MPIEVIYMTVNEAQASLKRWQRWATGVLARWEPDSPMALLARRRLLEAELRVLEAQTQEKSRG